MTPPESDRPAESDADAALRRIEERVQRVRDLGPFEVDRREDGRFRCELEKPIQELEPGEARQVVRTLESLAETMRRELAEAGED